ncbi:hypothetical protein QFZ65_002530 [Arthrobacter sp. B3I9]|nr:hypothetical protein [Arthrobacter sp. B3I9]
MRGVIRSTEVLTKLTVAPIHSGQALVPGPRHAHYGVARHGAVVGEVVAAHHGKRAGFRSPAGGQGQHQPAQRRRRGFSSGLQRRKVCHDVRSHPVQLPVDAEPVCGFGDGEGDDGRGGGANQPGQPLHLGPVNRLHDAADHAERVAAVGAFHHGVQAVLLREGQRGVGAAAGE